MAKILVADDEHAICAVFRQLLEMEGHTAVVAPSGRAALELFARERPDAVFLDVQMPDMSGISVLEQMHREHPATPVIVMTAHGTVQTAMQALQLGAFDYLGKPLELPDIRVLLERALQPTAGEAPAETASPAAAPRQIVGSSRAMQEVFKIMGLLTRNDLTVLITGESGVGKDLVARGIHEHGPKRQHPWVTVNCAAVAEHLLESELFGHEAGAFSGAEQRRIGKFEAAEEGTLFLDEISGLPHQLQAKLLRVLQERCFERVGGTTTVPLRARIIATTNRRFEASGQAQPFRDDFYYRLSLVTLHIPPLRERNDDIPALAQFFLERANEQLGRTLQDIDPVAMNRLQRHPWPGNVRELEHTIQRSALMARGSTLTRHDLRLDELTNTEQPTVTGWQQLDAAARAALSELTERDLPESQPYRTIVGLVENALVDEALNRHQGNQVAASAMLGINRATLRSKHRS